jgi:hypothetical protein
MADLARAEGAEGSARGKPFQPGNQYRFPPGKSGNPGGKRKLPKALKEALEDSIKVTLEIMRNDAADPAPRLTAAGRVQDYNLGKPGAEFLDDSDDVPHDRAAMVAKALDRIAEWYPETAKLIQKVKQLVPTEGEVKCAEESQP